MNASIKITSLLCFVLALLQQTTAQCTTATLGTMGYTNAAVSSGAKDTYVANDEVTFACNSGYSTTQTAALVATCTSANNALSWVLTPDIQGTCTDIKECTATTDPQDNCHANATCINIARSFACICQTSLIGDGILTTVDGALGCYVPTTTVISGAPGVKAVISSVFLTTSFAVMVL